MAVSVDRSDSIRRLVLLVSERTGVPVPDIVLIAPGGKPLREKGPDQSRWLTVEDYGISNDTTLELSLRLVSDLSSDLASPCCSQFT